MPRRVLVLCTGNSCRSIMAEALFNHFGEGAIEAFSAGSKPTGEVHPQSIKTLERHGIDAGQPRSKSWDEFDGQNFDLVVTVRDAAASEVCPVFLHATEKLHWSIQDPAKASGTVEEIDAVFNTTFNDLSTRITDYLKKK